MRINRKDLIACIERLNSISKKKYVLNGAYGGWQLDQLIDEKTGAIDNVTYGFVPARELYDTIHAIIRYVEKENRE